MKIRTIVTLAAGYALGAKLSPERIDELVRGALAGEPLAGAVRRAPAEPDVEWPDATFRI